MFFIYGLTWIFDIIAFAIEWYQMANTEISQTSSLAMEIVLVIFLVINACHGIIFFCIVYLNTANIIKAQRTFSSYYSSIRHTSTADRTRATSFEMSRFRKHSETTQMSTIRSSQMRSKRARNEEKF